MKRIKPVATSLLVLAMTGVLISWFFRGSFWGGLIFAACEAAMIGALADWFAVVALFRHPLGLNFIPHTAIIPNNRERIIEGIAGMVEDDWLSKEFISQKIAEYPLMDHLLLFLSTEAGRAGLHQAVTKAVATLGKEFNTEKQSPMPDLAKHLADQIKLKYSEAIIIFLIEWLDVLIKSSEFFETLQSALKKSMSDYAEHGNFWRRLSKGLGENLAIIDYQDATRALISNIRELLHDMKEPNNLNHQALLHHLQTGQGKLRDFISGHFFEQQDTQEKIINHITDFILGLIEDFRSNEQKYQAIEVGIKKEVLRLLDLYHYLIGRIVREKLAGLDDVALVDSLEEKVGNDLQWIRINGTVIGALVGIIQYIIRYWIG